MYIVGRQVKYMNETLWNMWKYEVWFRYFAEPLSHKADRVVFTLF